LKQQNKQEPLDKLGLFSLAQNVVGFRPCGCLGSPQALVVEAKLEYNGNGSTGSPAPLSDAAIGETVSQEEPQALVEKLLLAETICDRHLNVISRSGQARQGRELTCEIRLTQDHCDHYQGRSFAYALDTAR